MVSFKEMLYFEDKKSKYYEPYEDGENYCPKCGKPISYESDALNGFCFECTEKYDI